MLCLSLLPGSGSGLQPVDVEVRAEPTATVGDLAEALGAHLVGLHSRALLAPVTEGRPWPAGQLLAETGLRSGQLLPVETVPGSWRTATLRSGAETVRATIEVIAGPDAGRTVPLTGASATIGRAADNTVVLTDPQVSRHHAHLLLDGEPVIVDDGSAAGTVVGGTAIRRPTPLPADEPFRLGDSILLLHARDGYRAAETTDGTDATAPSETAVTSVGTGADTDAVTRTPRFGIPVADVALELPSPPNEPSRQHFPWAMMTMPVVMGASMMTMVGMGRSMFYVLGWPLAMLAGHFLQRRQHRKEYAEQLEAWRADCAELAATAERAGRTQRAQAYSDEPNPADIGRRLDSKQLVWVRRADDDDFLRVRVGIGNVDARTRLTAGKALPPAAVRQEIRTLVARHATLPEMPVTADLLGAKVVALVGTDRQVGEALANLLLRLAIAHSPFDVSICAALSPARRDLEGVLRWLPHTRPRPGGDAGVTIGPADGRALVESLAELPDGQHVVCVVDEGAGVPRRTLEAIAEGQEHATIVWVGRSRHRAPAATGVLIDLIGGDPADGPAVLLRDRAGMAALDSVDALDLRTAWEWSRSLSGLRDVAAIIPPDNALPAAVRMNELGTDLTDLDDEHAILARWRRATGLRAAIGVGIDGLVSLDLREDGPHGLVAGTTGAGKSELLQSLIAGLAASNAPDRITFLLVDYKGGAAFRECAGLPHTVGYITDLTPALVQRALVSMNAELTYREELLARYGAKDLVALERSHPEAAPPSMLICVDEFAALLAEVPDFIDGMVSIAQRGRSLGMHMLLATQRPSGVISEQIKANTDLRIALRVASPDDSGDVIDTKDAATISRRTPGRAWIRRTGHGSCELVQVAYVGGREPLAGARAAVQVRPHSAIAARVAGFAPQGSADAGAPVHERTDLDRLVRTITRAHKSSGAPDPRLPWLPALPDVLTLDDLSESEQPVPGTLTVGLLDEPAIQRQSPLLLELPRVGHVLIYGSSGSGKTSALRTCAEAALRSALRHPDAAPTLVYGIDGAGGALTGLDELPHVGTIVPLPQTDRVLRFLRMMKRAVDERNALLAVHGASDIGELAAAGIDVPRLLLLIDNLPSVEDTVDSGPMARRRHAAILQTLLQDGRRCGIHVVATSPQRSGLPMQTTSAFGTRLVLRMTSEDDYQMLGVPHRILTPDSPPGRALAGKLELQLASSAHTDPVALDTALAQWRERHASLPVPAVPAMPDRVPPTTLPEPAGGTVYLGVDADLVTAVGVGLGSTPLLVTGRTRSGRSTVLAGIATQLRRADPDLPMAVIAPRAEGRDAWTASGASVLTDAAGFAEWADRVGLDGDGIAGDGTAVGEKTGDGPWVGRPIRAALLLDDLHLWEARADESDVRAALVRVTALLDALLTGARSGVVLVAATNADQLRDGAVQQLVTASFKRSRRAALICPTDADGMFFGCDVPTSPPEPLVGPGRALLAEAGRGRVVQLVG